MQYYERWWQENYTTRGDDLRSWLFGSDTSSRAAVAEIADTLATEGRNRLTVLEHLPSYRQAIAEMLRVAELVAVAVFWRLDTEAETDVILWNTVEDVPDTFHNMYAQKAISAYLDGLGVAYTWRQTAQDWVLIMDKRR